MENKALIVDDDVKLRELLREYLEGNGFEVITLADGSNVLKHLETDSPDILILDIMLPGKNGLDILRDVRQKSQVPVIMLTAKGEDADRIVGLELGADDYLPKPFNPRELLARMNAVMRRTVQDTPNEVLPPREENLIEAGGLWLNRSRQNVLVNDQEIELSSTEYKILEVLMSHPNVILSRDQIMNFARGRDFTEA
jgi:two-component system phosphate regulon response regulator OmpR